MNAILVIVNLCSHGVYGDPRQWRQRWSCRWLEWGWPILPNNLHLHLSFRLVHGVFMKIFHFQLHKRFKPTYPTQAKLWTGATPRRWITPACTRTWPRPWSTGLTTPPIRCPSAFVSVLFLFIFEPFWMASLKQHFLQNPHICTFPQKYE